MRSEKVNPEPRHHEGQFQSTLWSVIIAAGGTAQGDAVNALESLCRTYWYPLYAFVRRRGYPHHEAQDLTQGFLSAFIASPGLKTVAPNKGRFRSFLIASLNNYLANEWNKARSLKRGGGKMFSSWEGLNAEERYQLEPSNLSDPEKALDREWARTIVDEALSKLRRESEREGTIERFELLVRFLPGHAQELSYAEAAHRLAASESAVKSAVHRLRRRFADIFRNEVLQTVSNPEDTDDEIRHLFGALVS